STFLCLRLEGTNTKAKVIGLEKIEGRSNYFIGNDPKKWRTNVPTFAKVKYENVYPGVDLVYYGNQGQLEYDFVVSPGADPKAITLAVEAGLFRHDQRGGIKPPLRIDASGDLVVETDGGEVRFHKPVVYQEQGPVTSGKRSAPATNRQSSTASRQLLDGHYV